MQKILRISMSILALVLLMNHNVEADMGKQNTKIKIFNATTEKYEEVDKIYKTDEEWKEILTPEQFHIMREEGTEVPFVCPLLKNKKQGIYQCAACGTDLFQSGYKFESGTGWPSFWDPVAPENIIRREDNAFGMQRVEVICARCESHLGHVFPDGPPPSGLRYCINGEALKFKEMK